MKHLAIKYQTAMVLRKWLAETPHVFAIVQPFVAALDAGVAVDITSKADQEADQSTGTVSDILPDKRAG